MCIFVYLYFIINYGCKIWIVIDSIYFSYLLFIFSRRKYSINLFIIVIDLIIKNGSLKLFNCKKVFVYEYNNKFIYLLK